jgi:hypothetical protein
MQILEINDQSIIKFNGRNYSIDSFAKQYNSGDTEAAKKALTVLVEQGRAAIQEFKTKEQKKMEAALKEEELKSTVESFEHFEEQAKDFTAEKKREGCLRYGAVEYDFPHILKAQEFQEAMEAELRIQDSEIIMRKTCVVVVFKDITDVEKAYIDKRYNIENAVDKAVGVVDKVATTATDAVHFTAVKVASPIAKVGFKAGANILKTTLTAIAKTAGTAVTATSQGIKSAAHEISHDPDVLKAGKELYDTKDAIAKKIVGGNGSKGGRVVG